MLNWANEATVIVTGAASGLGAASAEHFLAQGFHVASCDVTAHQPPTSAGRQGQALRAQVQAFTVDVTQTASIEAMLGALQAGSWPPVRVLINCAGIAPGERVLGRDKTMPLEHFKKVLDINLTGTFDMVRLVAAQMAQQSPIPSTTTRGVIINTASIAAFEGQIGQAAYSASKAGIVGLTLPLARELAQFGIRVVTIAPGLMATPMLAGMPEKIQTNLQSHWQCPHRYGNADEFARLAYHVCENEYLNGCTLRLDGAVRL